MRHRTYLKRQPHCHNCGEKIKKVTETIYFDVEAGKDSETSNFVRHIVGQPNTKEEAQRLTNAQIVYVRRSHYPVVDGPIDMVTTWDQESYEDEFFCTNRCAINHGIRAARRGE